MSANTQSQFGADVSISIVVPVYSGEAYIADLVTAIDDVRLNLEKIGAPIEIKELVLVDDAAIDRSPQIVDEIAARYPWVHAIHLSRNFGQHAATIAGILHSSGDWVVTMDEDLQHPPAQILPLLRQAIATGSDVVYAKPEDAVHERLSRDLASKSIKRLMAIFSGNANVPLFNSFRLIRGSIARSVSSVCGHDTYFDVALSWFVKRVTHLPMRLKDNRMISGNKSGYRLGKLISHARKMLMSSQIKVLRFMGLAGLVLLSASLVFGFYILINKLVFNQSMGTGGWASLALISVLFGSFLTVMLSIALEYVSSLLLVAHGKPIFFVVDRRSDAVLASYFSKAK